MPQDRDESPTTTRRRVLVGGALAAGAAVAPLPLLTRGASAQTTTTAGATSTTVAPTTTAARPRSIAEASGDASLAAFARGCGYAAAEVYSRVLEADDPVPTELLAQVHQFQVQHLDTADNWSGIAGLPKGTAPDEAFVDPVRLDLITASNATERLRVLLDVEQLTVATMLGLLSRMRSTDGAGVCAGIVASSARRATVLATSLKLDLDEVVPEVESADDAIEVPS